MPTPDKLQESLETTLFSFKANKLVNSTIDDLSSPKGLSFKTFVLGARFVLRNPVNTYNLIKLAQSSDTYLSPEFQKSILEKPKIWEFLKKHADNLPKIGQILAKAGFREFQEGSILDQKGLMILKEGFKNEAVLKNLQEIAVEVRQESPDWTKVTSKSLEMLASNENFKEFFAVKGEDIANYLHTGATQVTPIDYVKAFDDLIQESSNKNKYSAIAKIFNKNSSFKQILAENANNFTGLQEFKKLSPEKQKAVEVFMSESKKQAKPFLEEYFKSYKIDPKVLDTIPILLSKVPETKEIFDTLNNPNQGVMIALEKTLEMIADNKELNKFFSEHKDFLPNMARGIIENTPNVQNMTKDYQIDPAMLDIVGVLMSKPKVAHEIVQDLNKGDYLSLTGKLISNLNDPSFELKDLLVKQSEDGLFDNLIKGVLEQDEKANGTIKQQLKNYGLEAEEVTKLASVMPLLIDKPKSLQTVFSGFVKGNYMGMAKELIKLSNEPEIKGYLNDNKEIFTKVLNKNLEGVPGVGQLDKEVLYNMLLNQPNKLVNIIEGVENGNYMSVVRDAYGLARGEGQVLNFLKAGAEIALNYAFSGTPQEEARVNTINTDALIDKAVDKVFLQTQSEGIRELPNKKEFANQLKTLCSKNPEIKNYIIEKLNSAPIDNVGDVSTPKVNQYKHVIEHVNSPLPVLNSLYENIVSNQDIKTSLAANMITEQVSQKLFGQGNNRGEDFFRINQELKEVTSEYIKENPNSINNFLNSDNQKILADNVANTLNTKSKYTWAGVATGGIYLPEKVFNEELKNNFKNEFKKLALISEAKEIGAKARNSPKANPIASSVNPVGKRSQKLRGRG